MNTRIAEISDLPTIVNIYNQAIAAGMRTADTEPLTVESREQWFQDHPPDKYPILLAESESEILGYLSISAYRPGRKALQHTAEISYYIDFQYHRQGVASRLIEEAVKLCPALKIHNVFTIILQSNTASIRLMEKLGFTKWAELPQVALIDGQKIGQVYYGLNL